MLEMRECSIAEGRVCAPFNGKRVHIGRNDAILIHNQWIDMSTGEHHMLGVDRRSDPRLAEGSVSPECQRIVQELFPELADPGEGSVTEEYVRSLPEIYRDILSAFPELEPSRGAGDCLAFQTLYAGLDGKYSLGDIRDACDRLAEGGAIVFRLRMFACPTRLGEAIIATLCGEHSRERTAVPPFSPPPG